MVLPARYDEHNDRMGEPSKLTSNGNRLELRDPTWEAGMPKPTFEELANS